MNRKKKKGYLSIAAIACFVILAFAYLSDKSCRIIAGKVQLHTRGASSLIQEKKKSLL